MIPESYKLKRHIRQSRTRVWRKDCLTGIVAAPTYVFDDQEHFDSDDVDRIGRLISATALNLPHPAVIFEVTDRGPHLGARANLARHFTERGLDVYPAKAAEAAAARLLPADPPTASPEDG